MSLTCKIQITLNRLSDEKAVAIKKALEPDNIDFPKDLSLEIENLGDQLVVSFKNRGDTKKLISTVDEVLEHIQLALKVIE
ncbi:MAG TPA: KEOPS complex subunit Pcc1 [Candidatus Nitrosopelagicus sp.]|jgi:tRNA threonylcarbamoyladenosine modification (KEOPS) complex  Pcc1 subunit|nr:CTAG/PCC1 family protein [Candidatus Nitrosopelagicus sp.]MDP7284940.1 KEOPS complex subunit Pcc1 [Candidatus Nitrosopelagicus sp.]HJN19467.1 KEOPS complex subunit Pcc1 [Candidatus Nitrosopelagicus sp.]|tara:strand:- start:967 stop:1209 length:243 start_codon:yes stop_codon:yes gene_type:complete